MSSTTSATMQAVIDSRTFVRSPSKTMFVQGDDKDLGFDVLTYTDGDVSHEETGFKTEEEAMIWAKWA